MTNNIIQKIKALAIGQSVEVKGVTIARQRFINGHLGYLVKGGHDPLGLHVKSATAAAKRAREIQSVG